MKKLIVYAVVLFLLLIGVYSPVVFDSQLLRFDDDIVVAPMAEVHSLADYSLLIEKNEIYDVQPVRDLSYWLNSNHSGNVIVWFVAIILVIECLLVLKTPLFFAFALGTLFAFNPLFVSSVAWLTARKHLLSFTFTVANTLILLLQVRKGRITWFGAMSIVVLFLLGGFSQPINIMWPFFAGLYLFSHRGSVCWKNSATFFCVVGLVISGLAIAYLNQKYYNGAFSQTIQGNKYVAAEYNTMFWRTWAWGRMYLQMLVPYQTPAGDHYPFSNHSLVGIVLFILSVFILWKSKIQDWWIWMSGALLSVFTVLVRMTHVFAVDNYLLYSTFCIFVILGLASKQYNEKMNGKKMMVLKGLIVILSLVFGVRSYYLAKAWNNNFDLWKMSYEEEPSAKTAINYAGVLSERDQHVKAFEIAQNSLDYVGQIHTANAVVAKTIYLNPQLDTEKKIEMLSRRKNEWSLYFIASLNAARGDLRTACDDMVEAKSYSKKLEFFADGLELISAEALYFCKDRPTVGQEIFENLRNVRRNKKWNEAVFQKRVKELGVLK